MKYKRMDTLHKVSIIVPVYNVKKEYMRTCLDSIINQSYKNLEIILVDDGSTDDSGVFCDEIAREDNRIKVIHQENSGAGAARNAGTAAATGDYVMYVDADDIVAPYTVWNGVEAAVEQDADLVIGFIRRIYSLQDFVIDDGKKSCETKILKSDDFSELIKGYFTDWGPEYRNIEGDGCMNRGPYSRIIKREIAVVNAFPECPIGEDVIWNMRMLHRCRTVCIKKEVWYGYLQYWESTWHKYRGNKIEITSEYLNLLREENDEYVKKYEKSYAMCLSAEFCGILRYELLSKKCELSICQKIKTARAMLGKEPWNILKKKENLRYLSKYNRSIVKSAAWGGWILILKFRYWKKVCVDRIRDCFRRKKSG